MKDRVGFLVSFCSLFGCVVAAVVMLGTPLFFTFSRDDLALSPRSAGLYVRNADRALARHDLDQAGYYVHFLQLNGEELRYEGEDRADVARVQNELAKQRATYAHLIRERDYWQKIDEKYANYRDAKYNLARAWYGLRKPEMAKKLLEEALELDPQCEECKVALSEVLSTKF